MSHPLEFEPEYALHIIVGALTNEENQPHQWIGDPDLLTAELYKAFGPIVNEILANAFKTKPVNPSREKLTAFLIQRAEIADADGEDDSAALFRQCALAHERGKEGG